ncbi:hypothetical protein [Burkholderia multivorans]|uniref:Uncharacterized protein n=1 Tax=Burkholderia multivorans TaxID=87883 RepID=A0AB37AZ49_9BURK|nr:hypothetical protein [Burkholderia multivorans]PRE50290.1 hypothetical protein C6P97_12160 [Burkholderia multivorans]PRE54142.1 hypothetical protein C6P99_04705 [Burkholderia multivorans]
MPLPNGVDPYGTILPTCMAAAWLGNRGVLHDRQQKIVRQWSTKSWITCQLSYKGWNRKPLMNPDRYTELFFLDEATALSAGHRPCGMCRRPQFAAFKSAWLRGNAFPLTTSTADIDRKLHDERTSCRSSADWRRHPSTLPPGVIAEVAGIPHLWNGMTFLRWTPAGYASTDLIYVSNVVQLCTPPSIVKAIEAGYPIQVHPTALTTTW